MVRLLPTVSSSLWNIFSFGHVSYNSGTGLLYISICLVPDFEDQLASRLSARKLGLGLSHTLGSEGVLVENIYLQDTLAHDLGEELGVVGSLLGGYHIVVHGGTEELEVLLCEL